MDSLLVDQGNKLFSHIKVSGGPLNTIAAYFKAKHPGLKLNHLKVYAASASIEKVPIYDFHPNTGGTLQLVKVFAKQSD